MNLLALTMNNFQETVSQPGVVMVDCWASWCGACTEFEPVFKRIAAEHPEHTFCKLDSQDQKELVSKLGIEHIPTLLLYRDGILLFQQPGYFDAGQMKDILEQAVTVDMDMVRAEIEAETSKQKEE